jgi:hypothetical protein
VTPRRVAVAWDGAARSRATITAGAAQALIDAVLDPGAPL